MTLASATNSSQILPQSEQELFSHPQNLSTTDGFVRSDDPLKRILNGTAHQSNPYPVELGDFTTLSSSNRPAWINEDEAAWFDETGGFKPVATLRNGTVTIKLQKPGISGQDFLDHVIPFEAYANTSTVQTSFECKYNGSKYFYTGTLVAGNFTPVVTKYWTETDGKMVKIAWTQVGKSEAMDVLNEPENFAKLKQNLSDAGVSTTPQAYLKSISKNLGDLKNVWGSHEYDLENGYYRYQQHVNFTNIFVKAAVEMFGPGRIKGVALKIAYLTLKENGLAAPAGVKGNSVDVYGGGTLKPDI